MRGQHGRHLREDAVQDGQCCTVTCERAPDRRAGPLAQAPTVLPAPGFASMSRTASDVSQEAFRSDQDTIVGQVTVDPPSCSIDKTWPPHQFRTTRSGTARSATVTNGTGPVHTSGPHMSLTSAYFTRAPVIPKLRARVRFPSSAPQRSPRSLTWGFWLSPDGGCPMM